MTYDELEMFPIDLIRGESWEDRVWIEVDDTPLDPTQARVKLGFKSKVDANRYYDYELTDVNGGLIVTDEFIHLKLNENITHLPLSKYYADLLVWIGDQYVILYRYELFLSGVVTTPPNIKNC